MISELKKLKLEFKLIFKVFDVWLFDTMEEICNKKNEELSVLNKKTMK